MFSSACSLSALCSRRTCRGFALSTGRLWPFQQEASPHLSFTSRNQNQFYRHLYSALITETCYTPEEKSYSVLENVEPIWTSEAIMDRSSNWLGTNSWLLLKRLCLSPVTRLIASNNVLNVCYQPEVLMAERTQTCGTFPD